MGFATDAIPRGSETRSDHWSYRHSDLSDFDLRAAGIGTPPGDSSMPGLRIQRVPR